MTNLISDAYAADIVRRHFTVNQDIALAVAMAETGGSLDADAHNTSGEDSRGLWQINVAPNANPQYAGWNLFDPEINAQAAFEISSGGTYWCPWSVYEESCGPGHTGSYRGYLTRARNALAILPQYYGASGLWIGQFWESQCVLSAQFAWIRGGPNLTGQRLELAIYPFGFDQGISFNLPASAQSVPFTGFVPQAGYYWRIVSFFSGHDPIYSQQHEFIVPDLSASCYPNPPQPPPWPIPPPQWQYSNLTMLLGAGLVGIGFALALTPHKKKVIIKR